jgi:hypothetical protein
VTITDNTTLMTHDIIVNGTGVVLATVSLPYAEDFEGASPNVTIDPAASWVIGTPNKINAGTLPYTPQMINAHGGVNAIVTRSLTDAYLVSENSTVKLPAFDLTGLTGNITVSFWHNFYVEGGWDAGVLEYSVDFGTTWANVDNTLGTGTNYVTPNSFNWYNSTSTSGPIVPNKWSGRSNLYTGAVDGWIRSLTTVPIAALGGAPVAMLRYHFGSDSSVEYEGWAIDDIAIYQEPAMLDAPANVAFAYDALTLIATVSWDAVTNADSYTVYGSNDPYGVSWTFVAGPMQGTEYHPATAGLFQFYTVAANSSIPIMRNSVSISSAPVNNNVVDAVKPPEFRLEKKRN